MGRSPLLGSRKKSLLPSAALAVALVVGPSATWAMSQSAQQVIAGSSTTAPVPEAAALPRSIDTASDVEEVTIPAGTTLRVRVGESLASNTSHVEQPVRGALSRAIVIGGRTVVPAGSAVQGSVTEARQSGRVKGRARLGLRFHTLSSTWSDARYQIRTSSWTRQAPGTKKKDAAKVAIPSAGGGIIGAIAGGGKGAAIGAAAGGGAGTAVVLATRGQEVRLPRGSVVSVRLTRPLTVAISRR
jgi:hypothetical protein